MLTRLEIDNFRCFEGFVWKPAKRQLILGANGCGKSSMMDALTKLRRFVGGDEKLEDLFHLSARTRWKKKQEQTFAIGAAVDGVDFEYRLVVGAAGRPLKPIIVSESLHCGNNALCVGFDGGQVTIRSQFNSDRIVYPLTQGRSAIASLGENEATDLAIRFRRWMGILYCFRLNPFKMTSWAPREDPYPAINLANFSNWYRNLYQAHPRQAADLFQSLRDVLDNFEVLQLEDAGDSRRLLNAEFKRGGKEKVRFRFKELSEGQRCLICLYTIVHFLVAQGRTVIIDEPESFIGLRELQPWLVIASRIALENRGQLILISHNPELIDQWAPSHGVRFVREGTGAVRVKPWHGDPEYGLSASELVVRGWDDV